MASTYSTSLKIQLMGNGEDSGTWGSITNTNWNLIEQAVSGVQSITMANANYTLTDLNGVSDEARNMVLVVTGTNSAIYQIIAPLAPKFYVVTNSTSGGYAITIGGSSGSIITVPNGTTVQVYCNGTNFYSAQTSSAGNFNVNGNLTVSGTSTLTGAVTASSTLNVTGLITGSAGISTTTGSFSGNLASLGSVSGASGIFGAVSGTTITASTQFSGPGTGLTGTASSLTVGTATNATNATNVVSGGTIASNVTATTQSSGDNSTKLATTAYVYNAVGTLGTMASQNANNVAITGGTISSVAISGGTITGLTSALPVASGGTGVTTSTGSGAVVLGTSPTIASPSISGAVMSSMASSVITRGTSQASTSGTSITFTGIPSWAKRVTVMLQGVQRSGGTFTIRLGTSGGIITSGYSVGSGNGSGLSYYTDGFTNNSGPGDIFNGQLIFSNLTGNTWVGTGNLGGSSFCFLYGGSIALGATLTQLAVTTTGGTDTFTAGNINILYE